MTTSILSSITSLAEKLGIPAKIEILKKETVSTSYRNSIRIYNQDREIYGSFLCDNPFDSSTYHQILFGPLLMAEVAYGLEDAEKTSREFRQILSDLFALSNNYSADGFIETDLSLEAFYKDNKFTYHTFSDMEEFYKLELLLFSHIKDRNKMATLKTLDIFIKHYYKHATPSQLQCYYCAFITLITRVEIEKGNPVNLIFDKQLHYYNYVNEIQDIQTFESLTKKAIHDFFSQYSKIPKNSYSPITVCVLNYIENHIEDNITLAEICESLERDSKYVGKLFHKEIGMHYKEYVQSKKIEKSKYYLLFSNKSINEIAEDLSFSSQSHFSCVFKKIVGTTPNKYKKKRVYYSY